MPGSSPLLAAEEAKERHAALIREADQVRLALRSGRVNRHTPLVRRLLIFLISIA
jgi:hypothetical protein